MGKLKSIRLTVSTVLGIVVSVASLVWLFLIDIKLKTSSIWLIEALAFGLIPGIFILFASAKAANDEKLTSIWFYIVSVVLLVPFFIFTTTIMNDDTIKTNIIKYFSNFNSLRITFQVFFYIFLALDVCLLALDIVFKVLTKKELELQK